MRIQIHESLPPLLRGIGWTVVLLGTILAFIQTVERDKAEEQAHAADAGEKLVQMTSTNSVEEKSLVQLTREVEELRESIQREKVVGEVLVNVWFRVLGMAGSAIVAVSFYVEWICKRKKQVSQSPSSGKDG